MSIRGFPNLYNTETFINFIQTLKTKDIHAGVLIMNNVKFHRPKEVKVIIKKAGYLNMFVPQYSHFLNPIFSKWKEYVRRQNPISESEFREIIRNGCDLITSNNCESFFRNIFSYIQRSINSEIIKY